MTVTSSLDITPVDSSSEVKEFYNKFYTEKISYSAI